MATSRLSRGVKAFIEVPRNFGSEALRTREVPPSVVDVGTALRFNNILGPTDAKRLMALYREAAELRESGHDGLSPEGGGGAAGSRSRDGAAPRAGAAAAEAGPGDPSASHLVSGLRPISSRSRGRPGST